MGKRSLFVAIGVVAGLDGCAILGGIDGLVEVGAGNDGGMRFEDGASPEAGAAVDGGGVDAGDAAAPVDSSISAAEGGASDASAADGSTPYGGEWPGDAGWGPDADLPYYPTNYDEPYRAQYHFTAPNGWEDDVSGVWYYGGVFHLAYQTYPYSLADGMPRRWGHATSPDLVHWVTAPLMIDPGVRGLAGDAWSGSVVVDAANTSGLKTGANPVLVALYTATSEGTALAYSNDLGLTWRPYAHNPLPIGGDSGAIGRNPHVFWYAPANEWVCAHYEPLYEGNGTVFYTSPDLIHWNVTGTVPFGNELPDLYELAVDGNAANTKWVLADGAGQYLLGQFDGNTFNQDTGGPYAMDVGPSLYGAQAFYRPTFPDARVVQMAWIRQDPPNPWTGPWDEAMTFPTALGLTTFAEGVRLTRTPVAEISALYGATQHWQAETLAAGANLLAGITSKTYDLEVTIDTTATTATKVTFQLANESFTYDITNATLLGSALAPINGKVTIRILADRDQLEVFANGGELSYTAAFGFTPTDSSLSVTADGPVWIASADFRQIKRAWPGKAALTSVQIDDSDPTTTYTGTVLTCSDATYFDATCHVIRQAGSVSATLTGTRIEWHGLKNADLGLVTVKVDGTQVGPAIDCYSPIRQIATLFSQSGLTNGPHTIVVSLTGQADDASAGAALVHDFFASYVDP